MPGFGFNAGETGKEQNIDQSIGPFEGVSSFLSLKAAYDNRRGI